MEDLLRVTSQIVLFHWFLCNKQYPAYPVHQYVVVGYFQANFQQPFLG